MSGQGWKPGDVAMVTWRLPLGSTPQTQDMIGIRDAEGDWLTLVGTLDGYEGSPANPRPLVVIDPEDREQVERLSKALRDEGVCPQKRSYDIAVPAALRSLIAPPEPAQPIGPIVHAVMYRNHVMGTICNSGAWGTPELFTAVTEHVTCPACRDKLEGARAAS